MTTKQRADSTRSTGASRRAEVRPVADPAALAATTTVHYDDLANLTYQQDPAVYSSGPSRAETHHAYNAASERTRTTHPLTADQQGEGRLAVTTFAYDRALRTGYGYDAAGNLTRVTDGNGHTTVYDYQAWGLLEEVVEPSTPQHPDPSERTWTTRYDLGGLPDQDLLPGGVSVRRDFDELGRLTSETGCRREGGSDCVTRPGNPDAPEATREFDWDRVGRRVRVSDPRHPVLMVYDDRDLLVQATTQAHSTRFGYDADGRMTSRDDNAGTSTFTWTQADELASAADGLTGQRRDFTWDEASQLRGMDTPGGAERDWFYDGLGRVEQQVLRGPAGQDSRFVYDYDPDGNPVRQQVSFDGDIGASANLGEGLHRYCYDAAGRLTRWDRRPADPDAPADCAPVDPAAPGADQVVDYRWDNAGNRLAAGGDRFSYDQRNRMVSGSDGAYRYTARGTLADVNLDGIHTPSVFDALGRQVQAGPVALAYDGLDRLVTRQSPAGLTGFEYAGTEVDPVTSTGELAAAYARSPGGRLLSQTENGGPALLAGLGRHGDLTQLHTPDGTLAGSMVWDPFCQPGGTAGAGSRLGFQADWTDPANGQVWMGARWYDPAAAQRHHQRRTHHRPREGWRPWAAECASDHRLQPDGRRHPHGIHGVFRGATREVDVDDVVTRGRIFQQDGGLRVYVVGNGDGTNSAAILDGPTATDPLDTVLESVSDSGLASRVDDGRWVPVGDL